MKKLTAFVLSAMMVLSLAACGAKTETPADTSTPAADATKPAEVTKLTYAVEAGSAGEEVALANGYNVVSVDSQAKALMEVQAGTADAAIIDSLMAGAMVGEGTSYPDLTYDSQGLTTEEYGIGCRKGSDLAQYINCVLGDAYQSGTMQKLAQQYGITEELLDVLAEEPHMVPYLDMPIQHCDETILRRMNRPGNEAYLRNLIAHIRERVPDVTLRTTIITGFPGETKEQFNRLGDFVQDMQFDHLGCFAYSEEEGTKAAEFEDQNDEEVRAHRADILMEQQAEVSAAKNAAKIGRRMTAVIEGYDKYAGCYFGRTAADAPDIDGKIFIKSDSRLRLGQYITVEVFDTMDYDLLAEEVTDESAE